MLVTKHINLCEVRHGLNAEPLNISSIRKKISEYPQVNDERSDRYSIIDDSHFQNNILIFYMYCAGQNQTGEFILRGGFFVFLTEVKITVTLILRSKTRICRKINFCSTD